MPTSIMLFYGLAMLSLILVVLHSTLEETGDDRYSSIAYVLALLSIPVAILSNSKA